MQRIILLILLCVGLPLAASADTIDLSSTGGSIAGSTSGLSMASAFLTQYGAIGGSNLGSVSLTTGALVSGNITDGGVFGGGGSFTITGNGSVMGVPNGVIFSGTFSGPVTWKFSTATGAYTLTGDVTGNFGGGLPGLDGLPGSATVTEITVPGTLSAGGTISVSNGSIVLTTPVPEPSSMLLLGTGLAAIAGTVRRKLGR